MANPYYIPRDNSRFENLLGVGKLGLMLYQLKQTGDIASEEARLKGQDIGVRQEANDISRISAGAAATHAQTERDTLDLKTPDYAKPFGENAAYMKMNFKNFLGVDPIKDKENPLIKTVDELAKDRSIKSLDAYKYMRNNEELRVAAVEALEKRIFGTSDKQQDYVNTPQGKRDVQLLNKITTPEGWEQSVDDNFSKTLESYKQAQENTKAALLKSKADLATALKGTVVGEGAAYVPPGQDQPSFTNPKLVEPKMDPGHLMWTAQNDPDPIKRKQAQGVLDGLQTRDLEKAKAQRTIIDNSTNKTLDVPLLARAVMDGQDAPIAIKGSMGNPLAAKVKTEVLKQNPKFNFEMADANYKWKQSSTNQRTINFAGGALPRLEALDQQLSKLPNKDINTINKVMAAVSKEFGKPEYTNFESNRNAIVQEVNTALSGTSQGSDMRIKIELENLTSARSPAQIAGAISNLREALIARMDIDLSPLYPLDVVRGEKTMKQYKEELFKKYRGNYGIASQTGGKNSEPPKNRFTILKVE